MIEDDRRECPQFHGNDIVDLAPVRKQHLVSRLQKYRRSDRAVAGYAVPAESVDAVLAGKEAVHASGTEGEPLIISGGKHKVSGLYGCPRFPEKRQRIAEHLLM